MPTRSSTRSHKVLKEKQLENKERDSRQSNQNPDTNLPKRVTRRELRNVCHIQTQKASLKRERIKGAMENEKVISDENKGVYDKDTVEEKQEINNDDTPNTTTDQDEGSVCPSPSKKQKLENVENETHSPEEQIEKECTVEEETLISNEEKENEPNIRTMENKELQKEGKDNTSSGTATKGKSISLKSQASKGVDKTEAASEHTSNMPEQLLTVISNLYLNVGRRLRLDFLPRCLDDLAHCHRNHYHAELPEAPIPSQAHGLRGALQHYRYVSFINLTTDMCHRGEFPGKGIFTKLIELVLSINYNTKHQKSLIFQQSYHKAIDLFSMIVRTFPPCWHKIRTYYVGFLEYGLDQAKLGSNNEEPITKSSKIFDIILDLLEDILKNATVEELSTISSETLGETHKPLPDVEVSEPTSPQQNSMDLNVSSQYWNQNEYEERERKKQTFEALPKSQKIERIFVCLRLLLEILENDLAMWMLHHFKKTKEWIFCSDNRPLIVVLCELTQYTRMTRVARRIFSVYSESASKGLSKDRLQVLERYISLLMVASNTADMENTAIGVKYPSLGDQTKTLIKEFFKIFKVHNREDISKYMETIDLLRIPYVRFEFIDNVLFTNTDPLTPQKIALDMAKKRWLKYKPSSELAQVNEEISREQYLHLLLDALRQYCDWHGSKTFLHVITDYAQISHITTTNDSVHRWPTHGTGVLVLKRMAADIKKLETQLKMSVRMSKPKVNISLADICIDEAIILKYRTDLKFVISLQNVLIKQKEIYPEVDFSEWLKYLNEFSPKNIEKHSTPLH